MSEDNTHEVVKLLLARMKSHPEEFASGASRWGWMVNDVMDHCSDEERTALKEGLRPIRLQEIHEHVMDELCNGDERRRKEQQEYEAQRQMMMQQYAAQQSNALAGQYAQVPNLGALQTMGVGTQIGNETLNEGVLTSIKKALGI